MKKIRGDKSVEVIIHIYMEKTRGNSLCSYLYLKQAKVSYFSFFIFSLFSSTKLENKRAEQVLPTAGRTGTSGRGR
jgi:hypothetical protein